MINNGSSEQEADFECHTTDGIGLEEESDHGESDTSCNENVDTEPLLSSDLRRRLRDRLRKRFNEEDLAHFDDDDPVADNTDTERKHASAIQCTMVKLG